MAINWQKKTKSNYNRELVFIKPKDLKTFIGYWLGFYKAGDGYVALFVKADNEGEPEELDKIYALNIPKKLEMLLSEVPQGKIIMIENKGKKKHPSKPTYFWDFEVYEGDKSIDLDEINTILEGRQVQATLTEF